MRRERLKIMDWLAHGGHQYEFFKNNCDFYCTMMDGSPPCAEDLGRPKNKNVTFINEGAARNKKFDIIMVRSNPKGKRHDLFRRRGNPYGIAVMQTHTPFNVPKWVGSLVWNSYKVMNEFKSNFPGKRHYYIPHGFDPSEFKWLDLERNNRVISVNNVFKERGWWLGLDEWQKASNETGLCDLIGHGNDDMKEAIGCFSLDSLVEKYNQYSIYLNTTLRSAMPRARAEALMCGTPIVTTKNYDIGMYLQDKKHCLYAENKDDMIKAINMILESEDLFNELSRNGREVAIEHFHINDYIAKWNHVFKEALR
jgi:glycosyltransferase involved in cell wall biosynthesis